MISDSQAYGPACSGKAGIESDLQLLRPVIRWMLAPYEIYGNEWNTSYKRLYLHIMLKNKHNPTYSLKSCNSGLLIALSWKIEKAYAPLFPTAPITVRNPPSYRWILFYLRENSSNRGKIDIVKKSGNSAKINGCAVEIKFLRTGIPSTKRHSFSPKPFGPF